MDWTDWTPRERANLCFIIKDGSILLIRKKRGLGAGKIFRIGDTVANAFIEPQLTIYAKGDFQPAVQFFAGINFQRYHQ